MGRLVIVIPLREGVHDQVREILAREPPLALDDHGVTRCWAFVSPGEAVLVVEGPSVDGGPASPWTQLSGWKGGRRWEGWARSAPRFAGSVRSWGGGTDLPGVVFGPLPGPGDSEGGQTGSPAE